MDLGATLRPTAVPVTRAALNAKASAGTIFANIVYLITDENRLAVGLTASTYQDYAKLSEAGGGTSYTAGSGLTLTSGQFAVDFTVAAPLASPTFTGKVTTAAAATGGAGFNLPHGAAPTSPGNGDLWTTTAGVFARINGTTHQLSNTDSPVHTGSVTNPNTIIPEVAKGTVSSGTVTFTASAGDVQTLTVGGNLTIAFSGWPSSGTYDDCLLKITNGGAHTITWPTMSWVTSTGAVQSTPTRTLQTSGVDFIVVWSDNGGSTVYGRFV